jgi:hypothetical protein
MGFLYKIYGLRVNSSRKISTLNEIATSCTDLNVDFVENMPVPFSILSWQQVLTPGLEKRKTISLFNAPTEVGTFYKLHYQTRIGEFSVLINPEKDRVWICYNAIPHRDIESFFVSTIMGTILRLRGTLTLHASVIVIGGKAVAFLGAKKSGKSTTAAAFARLGYGVLADDMAVIREDENGFYIQPGYPRLRLRPATQLAMHPGVPNDELPAVNSNLGSRYSDITDRFCADALPLGAMFILSPNGEDVIDSSIEALSLPERLIQLGKNTFADYMITPEKRKHEFELLVRLSSRIPVNRLRLTYNINKVDNQCVTVLNYLNTLK